MRNENLGAAPVLERRVTAHREADNNCLVLLALVFDDDRRADDVAVVSGCVVVSGYRQGCDHRWRGRGAESVCLGRLMRYRLRADGL